VAPCSARAAPRRVAQRFDVWLRHAVLQLDDRVRHRAEIVVGQADDDRGLDRGMLHQRGLDLGRIDVLPPLRIMSVRRSAMYK
jgi:hypothetical protein